MIYSFDRKKINFILGHHLRGSTDSVMLPGTLGRPEEDSRAPAPPPGIIVSFKLNS